MFLSFNTLFGFIFFCFGLFFTVVFYSSYNRESFILNWQNTISVEGIILHVNKTRFSIGDETSATSVYEYNYQYFVNGTTYLGKDFSTGMQHSIGNKVKVAVQPYDFGISRINGMRKSPFGLSALNTILFPIFGLILMVRGIKWGAKKGEILSRGILTAGKCFKTIETNETENDEKLFKHFITYSDLNGKKRMSSFNSLKKEFPQEIELVFDKIDPDNTFIFDSEIILWKNKILNYCRQHAL